ncbi:MAG TPA: DUF2934 domain-containing protein [Terriglobales bacterium]|jgi:hypothetical protein|nr:DUF2934 domain-containing protein [Terriglobales bacterium]
MTSYSPSKSVAAIRQYQYPSTDPEDYPAPTLEDEIRRRAHELYEQRGRQDGHDVEDWLRAEGEVMQKATLRMAA